jgi:hypothetical protein
VIYKDRQEFDSDNWTEHTTHQRSYLSYSGHLYRDKRGVIKRG